MREGRKIATRAIQIPMQTSDRNWMRCLARKAARRIPLIIRRVLWRVRKPLYRDTIPAGLMDRRWFKYHSSHSVLPRRWRMSLRRSSVFLISFFSPSFPVVCYMLRQLEEVDGPLCPAPGSILFFRAPSTSQSDTPPHSAHFSPPLCQCTTDVDEQRAEVVCVVSPMTHEREKERQSGFDFISRMNMQLRDSHHHNYHTTSAASLY